MAAWLLQSSLSGSKLYLSQGIRKGLLSIHCLVILTLFGCGPAEPDFEEAASSFLRQWFSEGVVAQDNRCHGMGTLKHPEFTCLDMQTFASRIDPTTRIIERANRHDCFGSICGEFIEFEMTSIDLAGNPIRENAVLKRDDGQIRLYWYRSDLMLEAYRAAHPEPEDEKDPVHVAYDEITARYPALYQYPPCLDERVSSSVLIGELMAKDEIDVQVVEARAQACDETFCFALVGQKIATLCPSRR